MFLSSPSSQGSLKRHRTVVPTPPGYLGAGRGSTDLNGCIFCSLKAPLAKAQFTGVAQPRKGCTASPCCAKSVSTQLGRPMAGRHRVKQPPHQSRGSVAKTQPSPLQQSCLPEGQIQDMRLGGISPWPHPNHAFFTTFDVHLFQAAQPTDLIWPLRSLRASLGDNRAVTSCNSPHTGKQQ